MITTATPAITARAMTVDLYVFSEAAQSSVVVEVATRRAHKQ